MNDRSMQAQERSQLPAVVGWQQRSIAARLRLSYLISSTLPLLLVGLLLLALAFLDMQRRVYGNQRERAAAIGRNISGYVTDFEQQLLRLGRRVLVSDPDEQLTDELFELVARNYPDVLEVALIDSTGRERVRISQTEEFADAQLRLLAGDLDVQQALAGRVVRGSIRQDAAGQYLFTITLPWQNSAGIVVGALQAEISARAIAGDLFTARDNRGQRAYMLDDQGNLLIGDGLPDFVAPDAAELRALLADDSAGLYPGARREQVIGGSYTIDSSGWHVIVEQPAQAAFGGVLSSVLLLALLVALVGVLSLLWALRQAQGILQPLGELQRGAEALGESHLEYRIPPLGQDEFGQLAQTFNQMAGRLQHSLLEIADQNERLRHGLALARDIQVGLLPTSPPWDGENIAVHARSIPAYEVGGDFYTYLTLPSGRAAVVIGDISGKGVGAALLMALTSSAVETQGRQIDHPALLLTTLNTLLTPRLKANHMNAAVLCAVIDQSARTVTVANAGMIAPLLVGPRRTEFIEAWGMPLGSFAGAIYKEVSVTLDPGETLVLVSDGVVEAHNAANQLFGFERTEQTLAEAALLGDPRLLVELLIERVHEFAAGTEQHDDITVVAVQPVQLGSKPQRDLELLTPRETRSAVQ